jgi:hypothetical protein
MTNVEYENVRAEVSALMTVSVALLGEIAAIKAQINRDDPAKHVEATLRLIASSMTEVLAGLESKGMQAASSAYEQTIESFFETVKAVSFGTK